MLSRVLAVAASVLGVGALVLGPSLPASAATTYANVGGGGDINYLPSTQARAYDGLTDNQRLNQMAQDAYAAMKTQEQTDAVTRFTNGTGIVTTTSPGQVQHYIETVDGELIDDAHEIDGQATTIRGGKLIKGLGTATELIGGYAVGTSLVNGTADLLGIDAEGMVCRATADGGLGSLLVRVVDGATCAANPFAPEYVKNADIQAGHKAGWLVYPIPWSCPGNNPSSPNCYGVYTITPQPQMIEGSQTFTITNQITNKPQEGSYANGYCRLPGGGPVQAVNGGPITFNSTGYGGDGSNVQKTTIKCPAGTVLYAFELGTSGAYSSNAEVDKYNSDDVRTWFSPLSPNAGGREEQPANPTRTMKCVTLGSDGKNYSGPATTYTDEDESLPTPQCADLPSDVMPQKVTVERTTDGKTEKDVLGTWDTDQDVLDWAKKYPACTVHSLCSLTLQTKTANGWKNCKDGDSACADWFTSPTKNDDYRCMYGIPGSQSGVSLSECDTYQNRFTPEAQKSGDTLTDPKTGRPLANPKPTNNPSTDAAVSNRPNSTGDKRAECFPRGWGAVNPVNWVMQPVTCAMQNLFVPKASAMPKAQLALRSAVNNSSIGTVKTNVSALGVVGFGSGCSGIPVEWDIFGNHFELDLLRACKGDPLQAVASAVHTILSGLIVTLALLSILRYLAIIFGFQGLGARIERAREDSNSGQATS